MIRSIDLAALAAAFLVVAGPAMAADDIDLKLMGRQELGAAGGCAVTLWQANRDPDKDRFAIVFHERQEAQMPPATMKIGDALVQFRRVAAGGRERGKVYEQQLYRSATGDYSAILDLKLADGPAGAVDIPSGALTVVTPGKLPFRMSLKGQVRCAAANPSPAAAETGMFESYKVRLNQVPKKMIAEMQRRFACKPEVLERVGVTAFQLSEESGLWDLPCDTFAYSASSVVANVHVEQPGEIYSFLEFKAPPGRKRDDAFVLLNGKWNAKARTVTSIALGRGMGDCGTLEVHKVVDARFQLVEFREKKECDGKATPPEQWPQVYRGR